MARIAQTGWEVTTATSISDSGGGTTFTIDTATVHAGTNSLKCNSGAGNVISHANLNPSITIPNSNATYNWWVRFWVYFETLPLTTDVYFLRIGNWVASSLNNVGLKVTTAGLVKTFHATTASAGSHPTTIVTGKWYLFEAQFKEIIVASTSRTESVEAFRIDGVDSGLAADSQVVLNASPGGAATVQCGWITAPGANSICYVDDAGWNDDTGGSQNTWLGDGRVVMLFATSDNARATLWTGGAGGTTNLFEALNNIPPTGTATETNTTQIEHAGGAAGSTDAYDANMTTYAAAGIGPTDTINVIGLVAHDGEDSGTGSKLLAYSVVSNPAIASPGNVTAGDDVGALGTWPTNWAVRRFLGVTYGSSVTVDTAPVMRVVRPETASRVASVCFMAMTVDFTPRPIPSRPRLHHYPQLLAH